MRKIIATSLILVVMLFLAPFVLATSKPAVCASPTPEHKAVKHVRKAVNKPVPTTSSMPISLNRYDQALNALRNGRVSEAQALLQQVLQSSPDHEAARKLQVTLFLDAGKQHEAVILLREGQARNPTSLDVAMILARLEAEFGLIDTALTTLRKSAAYAQTHAPYLAFMAVLEQKKGQHKEAAKFFDQALILEPATANWLFARGVSRQILVEKYGARADFEAALASKNLGQEMRTEAQQRLRQLLQDSVY